MRARTAVIATAVLSGLLWSTALPSPATASPVATHTGVVTVYNDKSDAEMNAYWTAARSRSAAPVEALATGTGAESVVKGPEHAGGLHRAIPPTKPSGITTQASVWGTVGRLEWTTGDGNSVGFCTANVVSSNNQSTIASARHCGFDTGGYNYRFAPNYSKGVAPKGWWNAHSWRWFAGTTSQDTDTAFVALRKLNNRTVQSVVGSSGILFGEPAGYAALVGIPRDKDYAVICRGQGFRGPQNQNLMNNCIGLTGGASGGPWLQRFNESAQEGWQAGAFSGSFGDSAAASSYGRISGEIFDATANTPV